MYVGVDGHPRGWIAVVIDDRGFREARSFSTFVALMEAFEEASTIGVDIPIGLTDDPVREADKSARASLSGSASSVFNAPVRSALAATTYEDANTISVRTCGKGLSRQSYAILSKIREVDPYAEDPRVFEVHPKLAFRLLNDGARLNSKKTWGGLQRRVGLLAGAGIQLPDTLGEADFVGTDDVVDAAGVAWSARRIARGEARSFPPETTQRMPGGRTIAIWA